MNSIGFKTKEMQRQEKLPVLHKARKTATDNTDVLAEITRAGLVQAALRKAEEYMQQNFINDDAAMCGLDALYADLTTLKLAMRQVT